MEAVHHLEADHVVSKDLLFCTILGLIRALFPMLLMFRSPVTAGPVSLMADTIDTQPFVPFSRTSWGKVDMH